MTVSRSRSICSSRFLRPSMATISRLARSRSSCSSASLARSSSRSMISSGRGPGNRIAFVPGRRVSRTTPFLPLRIRAPGPSLFLYHGVEALPQPLGVGEQAGYEFPDLRVRLVGADALVVGAGLLPAVGLPASVVADHAFLSRLGPVVAVHGLHRALAHPAAHEGAGELPESAAQLGRGAVPGDRGPRTVHPL